MNEPTPASIAVIGDDVRFLRNVERVLCEDGLAVHLVTTPDLDSASQLVASLRPHAVLTELFLYGAPAGLPLAERLRNHRPTRRTPIYVTSPDSRELARRWDTMEQLGCRPLHQPLDDAALLDAMRHAEPWTPPSRTTAVPITIPAPSFAYYEHAPAMSRVMHAVTRLVSHR